METIVNYLMAADGAHGRAFDVRVGDNEFYVWERRDHILVSAGVDGEGSVRRFYDPMDALAYIHGIVKGTTSA